MTAGRRNQAVTGALALADGSVFLGQGAGAAGISSGELCFNTAMTGYQEILTDPSYTGQVVCFTFPHIGNVGANAADMETRNPAAEAAACGTVLRAPITKSANWRAETDFDVWLARRGVVAVTGVDTRALTRRIREHGMINCAVAHDPDGKIDIDALVEKAKSQPSMEGRDLAAEVATTQTYSHAQGRWDWPDGFPDVENPKFEVVVLDYGVKTNLLRSLGAVGARCTVLPMGATAEEVLARNPDGVLLANGPGDPAETAKAEGATIRALADSGTPVFGVCLGHQMLALSLGGKTKKMPHGHHGANHPVKDLETGKVEIVSMNHGFTVDADSLPEGLVQTHVSLFDGTNCGIALKDRPVFSVQHHPEASPGPADSFYLFERFAELMEQAKAKAKA